APATVVTVSLGLNAVAFALVAVAGDQGSDLLLLIAFALLGAGVGAAETLTNDLILSAVPAEKAGAASAISETAYETGAVLGSAVLGSLLNLAYRTHLQLPGELTDAQGAAASETLGGAAAVARDLPDAVARPLLDSARAAFDSGVLLTSGIGAVLMIVAAVVAHRTLRAAGGAAPPEPAGRCPHLDRRADPSGDRRVVLCGRGPTDSFSPPELHKTDIMRIESLAGTDKMDILPLVRSEGEAPRRARRASVPRSVDRFQVLRGARSAATGGEGRLDPVPGAGEASSARVTDPVPALASRAARRQV